MLPNFRPNGPTSRITVAGTATTPLLPPTTFSVVVQATQKHREPLDLFRERFGGSISPTRTPGGCWRWRATDLKAEMRRNVSLVQSDEDVRV